MGFNFSQQQSVGMAQTFALFISHAWDYKEDYERVVNLLNCDPSFRWTNLSVPVDQPILMSLSFPKSHRNIVKQLDERIGKSECILVLAGMYAAHRGWIQSEIEAAQEFGKPIIAVEPRGQERFPQAVIDAAQERVGWTSKSIISAVRRLVRPRYSSLAQLAGLDGPPHAG